MSDWRDHITESNDHRRFVRDTGVEVAQVVGLLVDGLTPFEVRQRIPALTLEDVAACIEFSAAQLDGARRRATDVAEMRRRIAEDDAHPDDAIPLERLIAEMRALDEADET